MSCIPDEQRKREGEIRLNQQWAALLLFAPMLRQSVHLPSAPMLCQSVCLLSGGSAAQLDSIPHASVCRLVDGFAVPHDFVPCWLMAAQETQNEQLVLTAFGPAACFALSFSALPNPALCIPDQRGRRGEGFRRSEKQAPLVPPVPASYLPACFALLAPPPNSA